MNKSDSKRYLKVKGATCMDSSLITDTATIEAASDFVGGFETPYQTQSKKCPYYIHSWFESNNLMDTARSKHGAMTNCSYLSEYFDTSPKGTGSVLTWATSHFANLKAELARDIQHIEDE